MKKLNIIAIVIIALGLLALVGTSIGFHSYTDDFYMVEVLLENEETGEVTTAWRAATRIGADDVLSTRENPETGEEEVVTRPPNWRDSEPTMHLDQMQVIAFIAFGLSLAAMVLYLVSQKSALRKQDIIGLIFTTLGMLTIIGFLTVFYPCKEQMGAMPRAMRCVWTMRVLIAVSGMIAASGLAMLIARSKELALGLNIAIIFGGLAFFLIPTAATGVCVNMRCNDGFEPFSIAISIFITVAAILSAIVLKKSKESDDMHDVETLDNF